VRGRTRPDVPSTVPRDGVVRITGATGPGAPQGRAPDRPFGRCRAVPPWL